MWDGVTSGPRVVGRSAQTKSERSKSDMRRERGWVDKVVVFRR